MQKILLVLVVSSLWFLSGCDISASPNSPVQVIGECRTGNGSYEYPIIVCSEEDLLKINRNLSANYALKNDINLSSSAWTPIGTHNNPFRGSFNGLGNTISNLYIPTERASDYVGLFGSISGASVSGLNVHLSPNGVAGKDYVGILAGKSYLSRISQCSVSGDILGVNNVGGMVGAAEESIITNSSSRGGVTATKANAGGIAGNAHGGTNIDNSYSESFVNAESYAGGIVGRATDAVIKRSYASGGISGVGAASEYLGGVLGKADNSILISVLALNPSVYGDRFVDKVAGYINRTSVTNALSLDTMIVDGIPDTGVSGKPITEAEATTKSTYESIGFGFGSAPQTPWVIQRLMYPKLYFE